MVKISWQLKKVVGDPKDKDFEVVGSGDIMCDRAVIVPVNSHGDCGMVAQGIPLTEALGAIREMLESDTWRDRDFIAKAKKDVLLTFDLYPDAAHPDKVEHLEYLRGIIITLDHEDDELNFHVFNATRPECIGLLEMTLMLQLFNISMQSAMRQAVTGPQAAMRVPMPPGGFSKLIPPR
ncbi:MAG: hypothetical protein WC455_22865 [Dehalococcoidia bacterium]|jgi:hypothetical protein